MAHAHARAAHSVTAVTALAIFHTALRQPLLLAADVLNMGSVHNTVGLHTCQCCTALAPAACRGKQGCWRLPTVGQRLDQLPSIPAHIQAVALTNTISMGTAQYAACTAKPDNLLMITDFKAGIVAWLQEYCKNGSVFDIIRRAEAEMKGAPQAQQVVSTARGSMLEVVVGLCYGQGSAFWGVVLLFVQQLKAASPGGWMQSFHGAAVR